MLYILSTVAWARVDLVILHGFTPLFRITEIMVIITEGFIRGQGYQLGQCSKNSMSHISDEPCDTSGIYLPAGRPHIQVAISEK